MIPQTIEAWWNVRAVRMWFKRQVSHYFKIGAQCGRAGNVTASPPCLVTPQTRSFVQAFRRGLAAGADEAEFKNHQER